MENNKESLEIELLQKIGVFKTLYKRDRKERPAIEIKDIDKSKLKKIEDEIPDEEMRKDLERILQILKNEQVSPTATEEIFGKIFRTEKALYLDNRDYVKMAKRALSEHRARLMIEKLAKKEDVTILDLRKIVRINFDLNGLKPMNDLGGHEKGNEGLKIFSDILKNGKTTKWLVGEGFKIIPSSEGGDEFGMVISGMSNDRPIDDLLLQRIKNQYVEEVFGTPASQLVDFKDKDVQKRLRENGKDQAYIDEALKSNFEFKVSTSMGVARLDQALTELEFTEDMPYESAIKMIIGKMFNVADHQALDHKTAFKKKLAESDNPNEKILSDLIDRDKGAKQMGEQIKKQAAEIDRRETEKQRAINKLRQKGLSEAEIAEIYPPTSREEELKIAA